MPEPRWADSDQAWNDDGPQKAMEILGLGPQSRKSKTFLTGADMAWVLTKVRAKRRMVIETLAKCHANHYERPVYGEDKEGERVQVGTEPDVLTEVEIIGRYSSARFWDEVHQEFVEHMASHEGFSVKAVSGLDEEEKRRREPESSAGGDRRATRTSAREQRNERW